MTLTERTAYLKGLCEGLKLDEQKPETRLINEIISLLDDMALSVSGLEEDCDTLHDYIEEVDEDLGEVEELLYDDEDECDCDECDCDDCDDDDCFEVVCPSCGETVCFDSDIDLDELVCPACNEKFDCECDDDECCCCHNSSDKED